MDFSIKDDFWWEAPIKLESWAGYQSCLGWYGSIDKPGPSDGSATLVYAPEGRGIEPLSKYDWSLISWFETNEHKVSAAVKSALIDWCSPDSVERAERFDFDDNFPVIRNENDLKLNAGLYAISIHQISSGGIPYIGYELGCEWEEEHGAGVLMHGTRVVEVGFASTAFTLWIAESDAEERD